MVPLRSISSPDCRSLDLMPVKPAHHIADIVACDICGAVSDTLVIGMAGTEKMYWAKTELGDCARIEVSAPHTLINKTV